MTTEQEHEFTAETQSEDYGNTKSIENVYEDPWHPTPAELQDALLDTELLTEKEVIAFVHGPMSSYPHKVGDEVIIPDEFEDFSEFKSYIADATDKVAQAIWIYELIDAYRFVGSPEECGKCGGQLGSSWVWSESEDEPNVLCHNCAGVDVDDFL